MPLIESLPKPPVPEILRPEKTIDQPSNLIEQALSACPKRIEVGETDCLKQAVVAKGIGVPALMAMVPGCGRGKVCRYDYTTVDRVGYLSATKTNYVVHWQAQFDFSQPRGRVEDVPIRVLIR